MFIAGSHAGINAVIRINAEAAKGRVQVVLQTTLHLRVSVLQRPVILREPATVEECADDLLEVDRGSVVANSSL
jgi:hypothetical protein